MSKRKLLLADDSITIQKVVNLTFADEGIEVISVGDGDSAIQKFEEFIPDLVMADVNMPGLTGYEVCQIIKQNDETRHIPVILLVGSFEPFDEEAAKNAGADDYLTKPFQSIRQLVNKVSELLNNSGAATVEETTAELPADEIPAEDAGDYSESQSSYSYEEPAAESHAATSVPQFEDTLEYSDGMAPVADYGDSGFDDEMIETSAASNYGAESSADVQSETSIDYAKTQPLNAADLKGFSLVTDRDEAVAEVSPADEPETDEYVIDADAEAGLYDYDLPATHETVAETEAAAPAELERVTDDAEEVAADETPAYDEPVADEETVAETVIEANDSDEDQSPEVVAEAETAAVESVEEPVAEEPAVETVETETPEAVVEETPEVAAVEETVVEPVAEAAMAPPPIDFDDGDLLELPPLVEETGIRPAVAAVVEAPEPIAETPVENTPETGQPFPPELIEAIAKKVAEQISAKTMADVLPQITELVMKKMAEEKND